MARTPEAEMTAIAAALGLTVAEVFGDPPRFIPPRMHRRWMGSD